MSQITIVIYY